MAGNQNRQGDVNVKINDKDVTLRLTVGALMDIEKSCGFKSLTELYIALDNPSMTFVVNIIVAMAAAGGTPIDVEDMASMSFDKTGKEFTRLTDAIMQAFNDMDAGDEDGEDAREATDDEKKPQP